MKPAKPVTFFLGLFIILFALFILTTSAKGVIPFSIGASLVYLGARPGKKATIIFGHTLVIVGCMLVTWGIYLLPHSEPTLLHILLRPLFWGLFSIFGGICALYHGFCRCFRYNPDYEMSAAQRKKNPSAAAKGYN
jgi:hypothetical protein